MTSDQPVDCVFYWPYPSTWGTTVLHHLALVRCVSQPVVTMEELRAMCITLREVKFSDLLEANRSKGARQSQVCQSRTRVWGTKMIRYRCSPLAVNHASSVLVLDSCLATTSGPSPPLSRNPSLWVQGGVPLQEGNLKELTE